MVAKMRYSPELRENVVNWHSPLYVVIGQGVSHNMLTAPSAMNIMFLLNEGCQKRRMKQVFKKELKA